MEIIEKLTESFPPEVQRNQIKAKIKISCKLLFPEHPKYKKIPNMFLAVQIICQDIHH